MSAWKAYGMFSLCALIFWGCSEVGIPLPFVDDKPKPENEMILKAKVRDFKEGNETDNTGTHPHFNQNRWTCEAQLVGATVQSGIATDGSSDPAFPGDSRNPRLAAGLVPDLARCFEPPDRFSDWYEDRADDVNRSYLVDLKFEKGGDGWYRYSNLNFFPVDNGAEYRKASDGEPAPFGHLQVGTKGEVDLSQHNYGFTMEMHATFKYEQGKGFTLGVRGDDDLWIFINGTSVLDLGGTHPAQQGSVDLDALGLTHGETYPLDIFFAERSVASSNLKLEVNFWLSGAK